MSEPKAISMSPWLYGLKRTRNVIKLSGNERANVVIVGGGIAGVSTAYFLLTRTDKSVVLIDRSRVAHASSGNNAGTATPIFERSLGHFIDIFGVERTKEGVLAVDEAWKFLEEMHIFSDGMDMPVHLHGFFGYRSFEDVTPVLSENELRVSLSLPPREVFFADERRSSLVGPLVSQPWLKLIPSKEIAKRLRTNDSRFVATVVEHEALVDTAQLSEKTATRLLEKYSERFRIFEESPVSEIEVGDTSVTLRAKEGNMVADHIVLATNGFEKFTISDTNRSNVNVRFHKNVSSRLAYMLGLFIPGKTPQPASLAYIYKPEDTHGISFEYVTERAFTLNNVAGTLLTIGGPDSLFNHERAEYDVATPFRQGVLREMERFLLHHYDLALKGRNYFKWHGLLGYTETNARLIGPDPHAKRLMYNLGCNGVGILLSLWGGNRIARLMLGEELVPTMFDPEAHFGRGG